MTTTQTQKRTVLDIQAEGLNELNKYSIEILNEVHEQIRVLIGKKIVTVTGDRTAKFNLPKYGKQELNQDGKFISYSYYFSFSSSLWLNVRVCINGIGYCNYFDQSIYIGKIENQLLTEVENLNGIIANWKLTQVFSESELKETINQYEVAKEQTRKLYNTLPQSVKEAAHISTF